jgi:hypothetical protein
MIMIMFSRKWSGDDFEKKGERAVVREGLAIFLKIPRPAGPPV